VRLKIWNEDVDMEKEKGLLVHHEVAAEYDDQIHAIQSGKVYSVRSVIQSVSLQTAHMNAVSGQSNMSNLLARFHITNLQSHVL